MQKSGSLPFWSGEGGRGQEEGNKVVQRTSHSKGSVLVDIHLCRDCKNPGHQTSKISAI